MNLDQRIRCLKEIDLFSSLTATEVRQFAEKVDEISLERGDTLFSEGMAGHEMYVLIEGRLRIFKNARTITTLTAIDYIGEMAILEEKPRSATVEALERCALLKITAAQFQAYFSHQPQSLVALMRTLSNRVRRDTEILAEEFEKANILIHDMRNVLCSFLYLNSLDSEITDPVQLKYLKHMKTARNNLTTLMEEALANAKRLHRPYRLNDNSLTDLLHELAESELAIHPDMQDHRLKVTIEEEPPLFPFNALDIRRVVFNLVLNAAQASPEGASVEVALCREKNNAKVLVRDRGAGIPRQLRDKIFESHFTTKINGNGLGLASCREIIERRHGGRLSFETSERGTTFFFLLPMTTGNVSLP